MLDGRSDDGSHPISAITLLQSALDGKVDNIRVLTDVPLYAKFTDTVYQDGPVLMDYDTLSPVTGSNKIISEADLLVYDSNGNGIIDNSELVNNLSVETARTKIKIFP